MTGLNRYLAIAAASLSAIACSSSDNSNPANGNPTNYGAGGNADAGTAQLPPMTTGKDVEAWLATKQYKSWSSEGAAHAPRAPSSPAVHGNDLVYSNMAVSMNAAGTEVWAMGAANVKELYSSATATEPDGYAVMVKTGADSMGGANWFFYERNGTTVYSDGKLNDATCVPCHSAAGTDTGHTPSPGGRDFVYTPVP
jgi:hypothetical protein